MPPQDALSAYDIWVKDTSVQSAMCEKCLIIIYFCIKGRGD